MLTGKTSEGMKSTNILNTKYNRLIQNYLSCPEGNVVDIKAAT